MKCAYQARGGMVIGVDGDVVTLINIIYKEQCTMNDIVAIRFKNPDFWHNGMIEVITRNTMRRMRIAHGKTPAPYTFAFVARQVPIFKSFYDEFLSEIRQYKGLEGTLLTEGWWNGWWTWPEEDAHALEPAAQSAAQPEAEVPAQAAPPVAPQPAQPAAAAKSDLEQAIRDKVAEEKKQKGPACPDCGCTSIFADKDETGAVVITCLNCGRKWHPGEHRSW